MLPRTKIVIGIVVVAALGGGLFALGRATAGTGAARDSGYQQGHIDGYLAGLQVGARQGRLEGRSAQEAAALPADEQRPARKAFEAGYAAGANDVFAGYDGGWGLNTPYAIIVAGGSGSITYQIATRTQLEPGVAYFLCPDGHTLCHRAINTR
jgi:hypothetical protein